MGSTTKTEPNEAVLAEAKMLATEWWNGARWGSLTDSQRKDALEEAAANVAHRNKRPICVHVQYDPPPIPTCAFDWCAWEDGAEEQQRYGYGPTRAIAVRKLFERLDDEVCF